MFDSLFTYSILCYKFYNLNTVCFPEATVEEIPNYVFFTEDKLVENCGLSLEKWNGIGFENFDPSDKYNAGLTGL